MRRIAFIALTLVSAFWMTSAQAAEYVEGKHYRLLEKPLPIVLQDGKEVAVWEYFSYLCGHCFTFEKPVLDWASKQSSQVQFEQLPAIFNNSMVPGAQTFYALQMMGADDDHKVGQGIFDSIHLAKASAKSLGNYKTLVSKYGVNGDNFEKMAKSFAVSVKVNQAKTFTYGSQLEGTPSMLVAGKYMVMSNQYVGGHDGVLRVVDFLIQKELSL